MTAAYAAKNTIKTEVVVRATGTAWPLRMKGFPPKRTKQGPGEVLVIDFNDGFTADAGEDARSRVQEYQRRGMKVTHSHQDKEATERNPSGGP